MKTPNTPAAPPPVPVSPPCKERKELVECRECLAMAFEALAQAGRRFGYIASGCSLDVANPTVGADEAMSVFRAIDVRMSKYPAFSDAWRATPHQAITFISGAAAVARKE